MIFIIGFHSVILLAVSTAVTLLLYYQKNYSLAEDKTRVVSALFLVIIAILMIISTIFLFLVPWGAVLEFF